MDGVPLLPLSQINERFTELDPTQQYYLHCKAGVRALKTLHILWQPGFRRKSRISSLRLTVATKPSPPYCAFVLKRLPSL